MPSGVMIAQNRGYIGLSQEKLAEQVNVSRQTIAMWETSKQLPSDNVAIVTARFLEIPERKLLEQLRWERLRQRVYQLEKQYGASITVKSTKDDQRASKQMKNATQTIDGATVTVTRIYKSFCSDDLARKELMEVTGGKLPEAAVVARGPRDMRLYHTGERLIVHMLIENSSGNLMPRGFYVEDNLGNQFRPIVSGNSKDEDAGEYVSRSVALFDYAPKASSFTLYYNFVSASEDDCDVLLFKDAPIDGNGITAVLNGDAITYNGIQRDLGEDSADSCEIHLAYNKMPEVRYVGLASITDDLGNKYESPSGGSSSYDEEKGIFYYKAKMKQIDLNASSISFKFLFARKIIILGLQDLPLPS